MSGPSRVPMPVDELAAWLGQGTFFLWRSQRIFVADAGQGSAMLLIHGYPTASYDWHRVWRPLASRFRVLAPDLLGLGFSDKPLGHAYRIADHADMIEDLLSHTGQRQVHVVAHDLGVSVAQELLARQRERPTGYQIRSLVLLNGGLCPEAYHPRPIQRLLASPLGAWLAPRMPRWAVERTIRSLFAPERPPSAELLDHFWQLIRHNGGLQVAHAAGRFWVDRLKHRDRLVAPLLSRAVPCRLINGSADPNSGDHMAQRYRALLPQADIVRLPGVGHWPQLEVPEAVTESLLEFVLQHEHGRHPGVAQATNLRRA